MKKVLFATTALVATAGVAAADITLSGTAEMGIAGGSIQGAADVNTTFFSSFDVRFSASGTADNGLSFGAIVDLEDVIDSAGAGSDLVDDAGRFADYTVFISGEFGTLTLGDTDGALDWAITEVGNFGNPGTLGDNETGHAGYFGGNTADIGIYNGQILRYNYSVAGFGFAVSAEVDGLDPRDGDPVIQLGLTYGGDFVGGSFGLGLGYATVDDANRTFRAPNVAGAATPGSQGVSIVSVSATVGLDAGFSAALNYSDINDSGFFGDDGDHYAIGLGYEVGPISVHANYGEFDWDANATLEDSDGWGLAAAYDFGGGLTAHVGYGDSNIGAVNATPVVNQRVDNTNWSFGLRMAF